MLDVLVLTMIVFLDAQELQEAPATPIAASYHKISAEYGAAIARATANKAPREELRRLGATRQKALRDLVASVTSEADLSTTDLSALAMAFEYLRERDNCIAYAFRAIERDPNTQDAYRPLIRSLLNANRTDDAEAVLALAKEHCRDGTKWHGMHYFVYVKHREHKQWVKALPHLETYLDALLHDGGSNAAEMKRAGKYLSDYLFAAREAGSEEAGLRRLRKWLSECSHTLEQKSSADAIVDVRALYHCAALCELRCEIARLIPDLAYDDCVMLWARVAYGSRWSSLQEEAVQHQKYFGRYFESNATLVESWSKIITGLSELENETLSNHGGARTEASQSQLGNLRAFANSFGENAPVSALIALPQ